MAHKCTPGVPHLLGRFVLPVHGQLRERLRSPDNKVDLHTVQQCPGELPQSFIQWFS
jgi:hypothetical protein